MTSWCVLSLEGATLLKLCSSWGRNFLAFLTVPPVSQAADHFRVVKNLWGWGCFLWWFGFEFFRFGVVLVLVFFCVEELSRISDRSF